MAVNFGNLGAFFVDKNGVLLESSAIQILGFDYNDRIVEHPPETFHGSPVRQVASSVKHTAVITDNGSLYTRGRGEFGALGLGSDDDSDTFVLVPKESFRGEDLRTIACGHDHTVAVTDTGRVYAFGTGEDFALGVPGAIDNIFSPLLVEVKDNGEDVEIVMVAAGCAHTMALSKDGNVFVWGKNQFGQLGTNDTLNRETPWKLNPSFFQHNPVVFIAAGFLHSAAVTQNGSLFTWGCNSDGQLGTSRVPPYQNFNMPQFVNLPHASPVSMVACHLQHTIVVTVAGNVWACGNNSWGALGLGALGLDENAQQTETVGLFQHVDVGQNEIMTAAAGFQHVSALVTKSGKLLLSGNVAAKGLSPPRQNQTLTVFTECSLGTLAGKRIGRCHCLEPERALAFCMGQQRRLSGRDGADSVVSPIYSLKEELVGMIVRLCISWPEGQAGQDESTVRLLGGGVGVGRELKQWPSMQVEKPPGHTKG